MRQHRFRFDSGYSVKSQVATKIFNLLTASILLLLSLPIFIILPILIKLQDGGPVFYAGERLGKNKKKFTMYKFRTLELNAEQALGAKLVSTAQLNLITPVGHFLRDTRLDELPQLINVIKGDMDIIGPRPEREIIYEMECKRIPWYDKRFTVKPGLFGYSQLFTPHSASRKSRALIDNFYLNRKHQTSLDITLLLYAFSVLGYKMIIKSLSSGKSMIKKMLFMHSLEEHRNYKRIARLETFMKIRYKDDDIDKGTETLNLRYDLVTEVEDMNDEHLLIKSDRAITKEIERIELYTTYRPTLKYRHRFKSVHCGAKIKSGRTTENGHFYVVEMLDLSELNTFKLHKYFLNKSIS